MCTVAERLLIELEYENDWTAGSVPARQKRIDPPMTLNKKSPFPSTIADRETVPLPASRPLALQRRLSFLVASDRDSDGKPALLLRCHFLRHSSSPGCSPRRHDAFPSRCHHHRSHCRLLLCNRFVYDRCDIVIILTKFDELRKWALEYYDH